MDTWVHEGAGWARLDGSAGAVDIRCGTVLERVELLPWDVFRPLKVALCRYLRSCLSCGRPWCSMDHGAQERECSFTRKRVLFHTRQSVFDTRESVCTQDRVFKHLFRFRCITAVIAHTPSTEQLREMPGRGQELVTWDGRGQSNVARLLNESDKVMYLYDDSSRQATRKPSDQSRAGTLGGAVQDSTDERELLPCK